MKAFVKIFAKIYSKEENKKLTKKEARLCGDFMMELNEKEVLTPWSLWDISKLFARINKQSINAKNFDSLNVQENNLFYILFSTNGSLINERLDVVVDLISETFKLSPNEKKSLSELYKATPYIKKRIKKFISKKKNKYFLFQWNAKNFWEITGIAKCFKCFIQNINSKWWWTYFNFRAKFI